MHEKLTDLSSLPRAALFYACHIGMPVFPVEPQGKKPLIDGGFRMASQHPEQVAAWWDWHPDANIGFSPGTMGWIAFDIDNATAEATARDLGLFDAPTLSVVTGNGRHLYFALPDGMTVGNVSRWDKFGLNIRSANGYTLLPPSIHRSGAIYRWEGELE